MCYIASFHDRMLSNPYGMDFCAEYEPEFAPEPTDEEWQRLIDSQINQTFW